MVWALVILLAAIQGITEFLPVSSSGHLRLLSAAFGIEDPQTLFDIMLHVGTLVAVCAIYRAVLGRMLLALWRALIAPRTMRARWHDDADLRLVAWAVIGTVPTGLIAVLLGDHMEALAGHISFVGAALLVNGCILLLLGALTVGRLSRRTATPRDLEAMTLRDALWIGTAQGFGIVRGISRSGSTITAGLLSGLTQEAAATFSFILSIPAILGAMVLQLRAGGMSADALLPAIVGAAVAAVVGTIALLLLLRLLRRGQLHHFAWYSFALGGTGIVISLL